ncbi:E3 ubiquitin-protein ligase CBL-C [Pteropus vampyrus]|uniref:E3 ubiquitin-protein ligase CBL n=1 Tax=Pteropus vampyrus TaxID=132908 RepID=A0A6P3QLQ5_PTEVA|nr:E3 ubiquitin-protein ligase CBL-C [Pteropus vampyrus]
MSPNSSSLGHPLPNPCSQGVWSRCVFRLGERIISWTFPPRKFSCLTFNSIQRPKIKPFTTRVLRPSPTPLRGSDRTQPYPAPQQNSRVSPSLSSTSRRSAQPLPQPLKGPRHQPAIPTRRGTISYLHPPKPSHLAVLWGSDLRTPSLGNPRAGALGPAPFGDRYLPFSRPRPQPDLGGAAPFAAPDLPKALEAPMAAAAAPRGWQWGEARAVDRAVRLLQRLEEQCGDPRLTSSPPSLRDLLPRTAQLLREVAQARRRAGRDGPEDPGGARDFLVIYLANLVAKSRQVAALLPPPGRRSASDELFREGSTLRRQLAKLALIFSHMLTELSALFPGGKYCGHTYQLTKAPAHAFWRKHCGAQCVLPWAEFESLLCTCHPVEPGSTALALRSTIDLTCSGHVSIFEFDIFTRLFQPWPTLLDNWKLLAVNHPGYMAFLTYDEVRARLQACREKPGRYLYPDGKNHNPDLTELCQVEPHQRIQVSEEQLQLYWAMDSTFELCKICAESNKNVKIEPCGHLLCSRCLATWLVSLTQTCLSCLLVEYGDKPGMGLMESDGVSKKASWLFYLILACESHNWTDLRGGDTDATFRESVKISV